MVGHPAAPAPDSSATTQALELLRSAGSHPILRCFPQGALIVFDRDLRYLSAGGLGLADVGLSQEMLEGRTIFEVFPPDVAAAIEPLYRRALGGEESAMDVPYLERVYLMRLGPLRDASGRTVAGMGFTQDVTDSRRNERALRESENQFRTAFEYAPIGKALIALDGRYLQVNEAFCRMTGYTSAQLRERTVGDITHPDDVDADVESMHQLVSGALTTVVVEKRYRTARGTTISASKSASLVRGDDGTPLHLIAQIQDITERKEHEHALAQERRRLREAQSIGHVGSWELDLRTDSVTWSDTLFSLWGMDPATFDGDYAAAVSCIHADDRAMVDAATAASASTGEPLHVRYRVIRMSDGELRWFDSRGETQYEQGQPCRLTGAVVDVTEQVTANEELEAARDAALEASRQKSAFLATMSHEIRTPMNAVIGMTGLLLDSTLDDEQRELLETVRSSGDALLTIINDILDFSKIEAGGLKLEQGPFELRDCVESALELVAATSSAKGLELVGDVDEACSAQVVGDVTRLRQVLVNLLGNAVKFTPDGEVLLTVRPCGIAGGTQCLQFSVADTGIGIAADRLSGLFDSFSQVDPSTTRLYGGTGLGLAISQRLVEAMGGVLEVSSTPGAGSTFSFRVALERVAGAGATVSVTKQRMNGKKALLVDDNATARRTVRLQLQACGIAVLEAESGAAALSLVEAGLTIDVALIDMNMPGMSGADVAQLMRDHPAQRLVPLVLLSSREDRGQLEWQQLFTSVLAKPVKNGRLEGCLRGILSPASAVPAARSGALEGLGALEGQPAALAARVSLRVLLAEDNAVNQRLGRLMLEKLGHRVDVAANGSEAVDAVHRVPYDVVLMDVEMPELDGLAAARAIRCDLPQQQQPHIIALTASALAGDREACLDAGMDDYLSKPVRLHDLDDVLRRVCARGAPAPLAASGQ